MYNKYLTDNSVVVPEPDKNILEEEEKLYQCYRESLKKLNEIVQKDKQTMLLERAQLIEERKKVESERISFRNDFQRVKTERMILEKELVRIQTILQASKKEYDQYIEETSKNDQLNEEMDKEMKAHEKRVQEVTDIVNQVNLETRKNNTARDNLMQFQDQLNEAIQQFELKKTAYQAKADQVSDIGRKIKNEQRELFDEKLQLREEYETLIQDQEKLLPAKELFLLQCSKIQDARKNLAILSQTLAEEEANLAYEESLIEQSLNQPPDKTQMEMLQTQKQKLISDISDIQKKLATIREEHQSLNEKVKIIKEEEEQKDREKHAAERTKRMLEKFFNGPSESELEMQRKREEEERKRIQELKEKAEKHRHEEEKKQKERQRKAEQARKLLDMAKKGSSSWFVDNPEEVTKAQPLPPAFAIDTTAEVTAQLESHNNNKNNAIKAPSIKMPKKNKQKKIAASRKLFEEFSKQQREEQLSSASPQEKEENNKKTIELLKDIKNNVQGTDQTIHQIDNDSIVNNRGPQRTTEETSDFQSDSYYQNNFDFNTESDLAAPVQFETPQKFEVDSEEEKLRRSLQRIKDDGTIEDANISQNQNENNSIVVELPFIVSKEGSPEGGKMVIRSLSSGVATTTIFHPNTPIEKIESESDDFNPGEAQTKHKLNKTDGISNPDSPHSDIEDHLNEITQPDIEVTLPHEQKKTLDIDTHKDNIMFVTHEMLEDNVDIKNSSTISDQNQKEEKNNLENKQQTTEEEEEKADIITIEAPGQVKRTANVIYTETESTYYQPKPREAIGFVEMIEDQDGNQYTRVIGEDGKEYFYFLGDDNQYYIRYTDNSGKLVTQLYIPPDDQVEQ